MTRQGLLTKQANTGNMYCLRPTRRVLERQVTACTPTGGQLLDKGEGIEPQSLELHGSTLIWTDAGETRSAVLE